MKKIFGYVVTVCTFAVIAMPASAETYVSQDEIVVAQAEEEKGLLRNKSFFSRDKKENKSEVTDKRAVKEPESAAAKDMAEGRTLNRERPDFANMSEEERKAWREKRRAEIEEMRKNMPPPKELTEAEKAERKARREKRRAEIEEMRKNMPPPKELTEAEKAERKARLEKRRAEIEKMRAENGSSR